MPEMMSFKRVKDRQLQGRMGGVKWECGNGGRRRGGIGEERRGNPTWICVCVCVCVSIYTHIYMKMQKNKEF